MNYENNLKALRDKNNVSQEELAKILNIDRTTYNHYENNYITIPIKHLIMISNFFQTSIDYIFGFKINNSKCNFKNITTKDAAIRLKEFRKDNKITQIKLAELLNTNQSVIANYERGRSFIATPFLYTICKKYNISADYLLGRINSPIYLK